MTYIMILGLIIVINFRYTYKTCYGVYFFYFFYFIKNNLLISINIIKLNLLIINSV